MGVGSNWPGVQLSPTCRQCFALELTAEVASSRRNSARSALSAASTAHHLLADDPILLACQFCDRLRDRINDFIGLRVGSLNDPHDARLRPLTVTPLSPPPHQGQTRRIRHFPPGNLLCSAG